MAATNKCLARSNKSETGGNATKKRNRGHHGNNGNEACTSRCDCTRHSRRRDRRPSRNNLHQSRVLGNRGANLPPRRCSCRVALREQPRRWKGTETGAKNYQGNLVTRSMDNGLKLVIEAVGSRAELARRLGLSRQAMHCWVRVPLNRLKLVSRITGIPAAVLRPDLFDSEQKPRRKKSGGSKW